MFLSTFVALDPEGLDGSPLRTLHAGNQYSLQSALDASPVRAWPGNSIVEADRLVTRGALQQLAWIRVTVYIVGLETLEIPVAKQHLSKFVSSNAKYVDIGGIDEAVEAFEFVRLILRFETSSAATTIRPRIAFHDRLHVHAHPAHLAGRW